MGLESIDDGLDQRERFSESEDLSSQRHVSLHLLESFLDVIVLSASSGDNRHNKLDEILHKPASLLSFVKKIDDYFVSTKLSVNKLE